MVDLEWVFKGPDKFYFVQSVMSGGDLFQYLQQELRFNEERFA